MNHSLVRRLIVKDWYLSRATLALIAVVGGLSVGVLQWRGGTIGFAAIIAALITTVFLSILPELENRADRVAHAAPWLRRHARMQPSSVGSHHGDPGRRLFGWTRRPPEGIQREGRPHHLGRRHAAQVRHRQRRRGQGRIARRVGRRRRDGMVYVNSGYLFAGHTPGNVLLAFSREDR